MGPDSAGRCGPGGENLGRGLEESGPPKLLGPHSAASPDLPALGPSGVTADGAWGLAPWARGKWRAGIAAARNEGLYTPPSEQGTILFPFTGGGVNWGGVAIDPVTDILYVNTSRLAPLVT